ncbi:7331_t:CDS:2, partial [Scutellospora calospora]
DTKVDRNKDVEDSSLKSNDPNNIIYSDNRTLNDDEKNLETRDLAYNDSINPMVASSVSTYDDPSLPCMTFRYWVLSTLFTALGAAISVFYYFRPSRILFSILFVILASYILGKWMEKILPNRIFRIINWEFNLNPGPFNYKEHVCIGAAASAGGVLAYAVDIIAVQELFYNIKVDFLIGFLLLISSQMLGYGLAGFVRKYLVYPANMIWPQSLVYATMYNTLHGNIFETNKKIRFFYIAFASMLVWQFIPEYLFLWLTSISILCLVAPGNNVAKLLGSGYRGAGVLDFTLNWNSIDAQKFPFLSTHSFDKFGKTALNVTAYNNYSPVYISTAFAVVYGYNFAQFTAVIVHVLLFHGKEIWSHYKQTREEELDDIHCKLMSVYP